MEFGASYADYGGARQYACCGYKVTFLVNETKVKLTRNFPSPYLAKQFVNKLRHSKRCTLLSYPSFS